MVETEILMKPEEIKKLSNELTYIVGALKERGLVLWSHDGNGSEGTYVTITELGKKKMEKQEKYLKKYYGNVIRKFGKEKLIQLIELMKDLENIMNIEVVKLEV